MNLRLDPDIAEALREEAQRTGRSQQQVIRDSIAEHLGRGRIAAPRSALEDLVRVGRARPPRTPLRTDIEPVHLAPAATTDELLDREDRF